MPRAFNPPGLYAPETYANAVEVGPGERLVVSSGIVGMTEDGVVPDDPKAQVDLAWANVAAWLDGCGLSADDLVKLTTHFARAEIVALSRDARIRTFGPHFGCAVTALIVPLIDDSLVIEIDILAAAPS
jgi:enamine deaminase RidA (YjgF/YER057c/UK114 family)